MPISDDDLPAIFGYPSYYNTSDTWRATARTALADGARLSEAAFLCRVLGVMEAFNREQSASRLPAVSVQEWKTAAINAFAPAGHAKKKDLAARFDSWLQQLMRDGWVHERDEDRWRPGMASGSGYTTVYSLAFAGREAAFPPLPEDKPQSARDIAPRVPEDKPPACKADPAKTERVLYANGITPETIELRCPGLLHDFEEHDLQDAVPWIEAKIIELAEWEKE